jgi:DNA-binding response OmpR family regulator
MSTNGQRILVIGGNSPLLEGVADLLQLAGYQVDQSSSWTETRYAIHVRPPNLAIVDLSSPASDVYRMSDEIYEITHGSGVPVLFISFSGDDRIQELQRKSRANNTNGRLQFYAHTLLSIDGLLDKVQACLS